jgi:hypothetical protein
MDILIPLLIALTLSLLTFLLLPSRKPKRITHYPTTPPRLCAECGLDYERDSSNAQHPDRYCGRRCEELDHPEGD